MKKVYFAHVLRRCLGDCTNGGTTSKNVLLYLFAEDWTEGEIANYIEKRGVEREKCIQIERSHNGYVSAQVVFKTRGMLYVFGGNYVTGDSSFHQVLNRYPIPVHDRAETPEEYEAMSI